MEECLNGVKDRSPEATVRNSSLQRDKISQYADHRVYSVNIYVGEASEEYLSDVI